MAVDEDYEDDWAIPMSQAPQTTRTTFGALRKKTVNESSEPARPMASVIAGALAKMGRR